MEQAVHDSEGKGFEAGTSIALFGQPGTGKFEFVLTGRHITRRCDGDSVRGVAFGGPIFYGHQAGDKDREAAEHPGNVFWYQAQRANQVFQALDGKQRDLALLGESRDEDGSDTVKLTGKTGVEMEALTAVSVACLTIYDMLKAVDRAMRIEAVRLTAKSGGASGDYKAE